jgi:hypothetical protein
LAAVFGAAFTAFFAGFSLFTTAAFVAVAFGLAVVEVTFLAAVSVVGLASFFYAGAGADFTSAALGAAAFSAGAVVLIVGAPIEIISITEKSWRCPCLF